MRYLLSMLGMLVLASSGVAASGDKPATARHFVYIDYEIIWTIELVGTGWDTVPVINIITFNEGEWVLKPAQVKIRNADGAVAKVDKFSMETGADPYVTPLFRVLGDSFIGIDLIGDFEGFEEPAAIRVDLGKYHYDLDPIDPLGFERLVDKINKVNFNSPDIREDYEVLDMPFFGKRSLRPPDERQ